MSWVEVFEPCQRHASFKTASILSRLCWFSVTPGIREGEVLLSGNLLWYLCLLLLLNYLLMLFINLFLEPSSLKDN